MEQQDLELERRVWQRVSGAQVPAQGECTSLREMEQRSRESAMVFRQLAQTSTGLMRDTLQELHRQEYGNALTLLGIRVLSGEEPEKQPGCPRTKTGTCRALALAFRRSSRAREDYAARASAGEFAPVFAAMEREEGEKMRKILALIGLAKGG